MINVLRSTAISIMATITFTIAAESNDAHPFPMPDSGYVRHVIPLPEKSRDEEINFKVEIIAGASIKTDGTNRYRLNTSLTPEPLKGWGYTYYVMSGTKQLLSTMMAPLEKGEKTEQFVPGTPLTIRYNSRLPIVVYTPVDFQIRYRIWEAPIDYRTAQEK